MLTGDGPSCFTMPGNVNHRKLVVHNCVLVLSCDAVRAKTLQAGFTQEESAQLNFVCGCTTKLVSTSESRWVHRSWLRNCPLVLGIDEHFFTRRKGFATTLCDLKNHKIYDVVLGRSELSLETYFQGLQGKEQVKVVCMDLATHYRSLVRKHFPKAKIVADRFHVIRLINQH